MNLSESLRHAHQRACDEWLHTGPLGLPIISAINTIPMTTFPGKVVTRGLRCFWTLQNDKWPWNLKGKALSTGFFQEEWILLLLHLWSSTSAREGKMVLKNTTQKPVAGKPSRERAWGLFSKHLTRWELKINPQTLHWSGEGSSTICYWAVSTEEPLKDTIISRKICFLGMSRFAHGWVQYSSEKTVCLNTLHSLSWLCLWCHKRQEWL